MKIILDVLNTTGITATAGIGTNLYLCKVAMDIVAKHIPADENGVRIAERWTAATAQKLCRAARPLTDFWRVGRGYAKKLEANGMFTMGDVARRSLTDEDFLFKLFGKNAELLIDHAWGYEPCTVEAVKAYKPGSQQPWLWPGAARAVHRGQGAACAARDGRRTVDGFIRVENLVTDQLVVTIGYDVENIKDAKRRAQYKGKIVRNGYGRLAAKHSHGTVKPPALHVLDEADNGRRC